MWETILASVTVEIGEHAYHAAIIRRGESPNQTYWIMAKGNYHQFNGRGDDTVATVVGITRIGLILGDELFDFEQPKGPPAEQ